MIGCFQNTNFLYHFDYPSFSTTIKGRLLKKAILTSVNAPINNIMVAGKRVELLLIGYEPIRLPLPYPAI